MRWVSGVSLTPITKLSPSPNLGSAETALLSVEFCVQNTTHHPPRLVDLSSYRVIASLVHIVEHRRQPKYKIYTSFFLDIAKFIFNFNFNLVES